MCTILKFLKDNLNARQETFLNLFIYEPTFVLLIYRLKNDNNSGRKIGSSDWIKILNLNKSI